MRALLVILCWHGAAAAWALTAIEAINAVPEVERQRLVQIVGCEANPQPDRWHVLVHDEHAENGYREYVVAKQGVVAAREISQFGGDLGAEDIIPPTAVKVDSATVALLAREVADPRHEFIQ